MLSTASMELLAKTKAAKVELNFKYAWSDDHGAIWMKKDDSSLPKQIYNAKSFERLAGETD